MKSIKSQAVDHLFEAVLTLKSVDECYKFFEDVCTVKELLDLAQRFEVAIMLSEGKSYMDISKISGASSATISRVNRSLMYGNGGYDIVMERMEDTGGGQ